MAVPQYVVYTNSVPVCPYARGISALLLSKFDYFLV